MNALFLVGRILFGGYFVFNAINHFTHLEMMAGYSQSKGVPAPKAAVAGTGTLLLLGGLSELLGVYPLIGGALLVIFLIGVTFKMHNFWAVQDPMARMGEFVNFTKNIGLLGAVLITMAIPAPWPLSL